MSRATNKDVPRLVAYRHEFKTGHEAVFGTWSKTPSGEDVYTVYSYGRHFPMAAWFDNTRCWVVNEDKYSNTTSRHQGLVRSAIRMCSTHRVGYVSTGVLKDLIGLGVYQLIASIEDTRAAAALAVALKDCIDYLGEPALAA